MKQKKIPVRMCAACREGKPKRELLRIVKNSDGMVLFDNTGKAAGRGAYICASTDCLARAIKTRALARALDAAIPDELYERLAAAIEERVREE